MGKLSILATIALMVNVTSFASLVATIYQTHNTSSYNWLYLFGNLLAQLLLIIYGLANNAPEIYGPTILLFFGLSYIIYDKYKYSNFREEKNK